MDASGGVDSGGTDGGSGDAGGADVPMADAGDDVGRGDAGADVPTSDAGPGECDDVASTYVPVDMPGHLVAACDEEGAVFADPKDLRRQLDAPGGTRSDPYGDASCPGCDEVAVVDFDLATPTSGCGERLRCALPSR